MNPAFDEEALDFTCPNCKKQVSEKVGRMKRKDYTCPRCGVALDTKQFRRELERVEQEWDKLLRDLSGVKVEIKL